MRNRKVKSRNKIKKKGKSKEKKEKKEKAKNKIRKQNKERKETPDNRDGRRSMKPNAENVKISLPYITRLKEEESPLEWEKKK